MTTQQAILNAMQQILELDQSELLNNLDLDLFESGLVDSLAMVTLITEIEANVGCKIMIKSMSPDDFSTINRLTAAIDRQRGGQ